MKQRNKISRRLRKYVYSRIQTLKKRLHEKENLNHFYTGRKLLSVRSKKITAYETEDIAEALLQAVENNEEDTRPFIISLGAALLDGQGEAHDELDENAVSGLENAGLIQVPENLMKLEQLIKQKELDAAIAMAQLKQEHHNSKSVLKGSTGDRGHLLKKRRDRHTRMNSATRLGTARKLLSLVVVNDQWGQWKAWSKCSAECGSGGFSVRRRKCESEPEIRCEDSNFDIKTCNVGIKCQATFSEWGIWGPCSRTCGEGIRARNRVCVTKEKGLKCRGLSSVLERCKVQKCGKPEPVTAVPPETVMKSIKAAGYHAVAVPLFYELPNHIFSTTPDYEKTIPPAHDIPKAPLIVPAKKPGRKLPPTFPYIWAIWGDWSLCSSHCDVGHRARLRQCIDSSQDPPIKMMTKWCGVGTDVQTVECIGTCSNYVHPSDENRMPAKVKVIDTGNAIGPHVLTHHEQDKEMKLSRAEVVETGSQFGPDVIHSHSHYSGNKDGPLARVEVIETGNDDGPFVHTEHEGDGDDMSEASTSLTDEDSDLELTPLTIFFIAIFLLCILLVILSFCIYFCQRMQESRKLEELANLQPFYKQEDGYGGGGRTVDGVVKPVVKANSQFQDRSSEKLRTKAQAANKKRRMQKKKNLRRRF